MPRQIDRWIFGCLGFVKWVNRSRVQVGVMYMTGLLNRASVRS